jgi:hypothetical protein
MQKWQQDMLNMFGNPMMPLNQAQMGASQANAGSSNSSYPTSFANPMMAFNQAQMGQSLANAGSSNNSYPASIGNTMMPFMQPQMPFKMVRKSKHEFSFQSLSL